MKLLVLLFPGILLGQSPPVAGPDLEIDLIAAEPVVQQPSFLRFDERGRMWVVQYRQYPLPAGVQMTKRDRYWRNTYDQIPAPPGSDDFVEGKDRITIHEDTNQDGRFDQVTTFLEGLNFATSLAWDRDGVWVLQPPYLLYYHDRNQDDQVDGPPEIHLSGFGIEDSHAIANSLTWGPDGWLYGAQGSTVTAAIHVAGSNSPPVKSSGQLIWRYHPSERIYEIFAEGGGNIWSCQFDSKGRLFAGTNEGEKLGYHYLQGSYSQKNFGKHGDLSNPYAYGFLKGIKEDGLTRVTTNLFVYEETSFPERYHGAVISSNGLTGKVNASRLLPIGPTFSSKSIDSLASSSDTWFRPVYSDIGPDGAIYVADWHDQQINHFRNHEGKMSPQDGRIYRIRSEKKEQVTKVDLRSLTSEQLVKALRDPRRWYRSTARRLLKQRQDQEVLPSLKMLLSDEEGQVALEALWAINLLGGFDSEAKEQALQHANDHMRIWAIRLIGDRREVSNLELKLMCRLAAVDQNDEVLQQLASSARRLPVSSSLTILKELIKRQKIAADRSMSLLVWWAVEEACTHNRGKVLDLFEDQTFFQMPMARRTILPFLMRRLASEGQRGFLRSCARLLRLAPDLESQRILIESFELAYRGRAMTGLPDELLSAISLAGGGSLPMRLRQSDPEAINKAKEVLEDKEADLKLRRRVIEALGEVPQAELLPAILAQLRVQDFAIQEATFSALRAYNHPSVGAAVVAIFPNLNEKVKPAAMTLIASRAEPARQWLKALAEGKFGGGKLTPDLVRKFQRLDDQKVDVLLKEIPRHEFAADVTEANRIRNIMENTELARDMIKGREIYLSRCAACHELHGEGGKIGPDLTGYQRGDFESLLLAIVAPDAEIREGFENTVIRTKDEQILAGFIVDQDDHAITLRPVGGDEIVIARQKINTMSTAENSLMPAGLLVGLDDRELANFFGYLQSPQPPNARK